MATSLETLRKLHHSCDFCRRVFLLDNIPPALYVFREVDKPGLATLNESQQKCLSKLMKLWSESGASAVSDAERRFFHVIFSSIVFFDLDEPTLITASVQCTFAASILDGSRKALKGLHWGSNHVLGVCRSTSSNVDELLFRLYDLQKWAEWRKWAIERSSLVDLMPGYDIAQYYMCSLPATNYQVRDEDEISPINATPASTESFALTKSWLEKCLKTHKKCPKPSFYVPKRFLMLSRDEKGTHVSLNISDDYFHEDQYAALSYCWGGDQPLKLTASSVSQLQQDIPVESLPRTIQDAVQATLNLGLHRLWVDALCIFQDDDKDKAVEITRMPQIYRNALVTLVATRPSSVHEGFLHERPEGAIKGFELPSPKHVGGSVFLIPHQPSKSLMNKYHYFEPLDDRAWSLQERLLSARIIDYRGLVTTWICEELQTSKKENWWIDGWQPPRYLTRFQGMSTTKSVITFNDTAKRTPRTAAINNKLVRFPRLLYYSRLYSRNSITKRYPSNWGRLIEEYSARLHSFPDKDRLPALSALSRVYQDQLKLDFVAGFWPDQFPTFLLWRLINKVWPKPSSYWAPSWSWLSVRGQVEYDFDIMFAALLDCKIYASVIRWETVPLRKDAPLGTLKSATLTLRGLLKRAYWALPAVNELDGAQRRANDLLDRVTAQRPGHGNGTETSEETFVYIPEDIEEDTVYSGDLGRQEAPGGRLRPVVKLLTASRTGDLEQLLAKSHMDYLHENIEPLNEVYLMPICASTRDRGLDRQKFLKDESYRMDHPLEKNPPEDIPLETRGLILKKLANDQYARVGVFTHEASAGPRRYGTSSRQHITNFWPQRDWLLSGEKQEITVV